MSRNDFDICIIHILDVILVDGKAEWYEGGVVGVVNNRGIKWLDESTTKDLRQGSGAIRCDNPSPPCPLLPSLFGLF